MSSYHCRGCPAAGNVLKCAGLNYCIAIDKKERIEAANECNVK